MKLGGIKTVLAKIKRGKRKKKQQKEKAICITRCSDAKDDEMETNAISPF